LGNIFLVSTKLDTFCYLTVQTVPCYVPYRRVTGRRTGGQTDGIATEQTVNNRSALGKVMGNNTVSPYFFQTWL